MKRLLRLATLCMAATLLLAPAALAQGVPPQEGTGNPYGCPDGYPFVASDPDDPGEASLLCFATEAEAEAYGSGETATPPVEEETPPTTTGGQYETPEAPTAEPEAMMEPLPDTGGPGAAALLLPVAGLLLGAGLLGLRVARRRS